VLNHGNAHVSTPTIVNVTIYCLAASLRCPIPIAIRRFSFPSQSPNHCWHRITMIFYPEFSVHFRCTILVICAIDFFGNTSQRFNPFSRSSYRHPLFCDNRLGATSQIVSRDCRLTSIRKMNTSEAWVGID